MQKQFITGPSWRSNTLIYLLTGLTFILCLQISLPMPPDELRIKGAICDGFAQQIKPNGTDLASCPSDLPPDTLARRYTFSIEEPRRQLAILLRTSVPSATILLNGQSIQAISGPSVSLIPTYIYHLVQLPDGFLKAGSNTLDVFTAAVPEPNRSVPGWLYLGGIEELRSPFSNIIFLTQILPLANLTLRLLLALMLIGFFLARRQERAYLYFAFALLSGVPPLLRYIASVVGLPDLLQGNLGVSWIWQSFFLTAFAFHLHGGRIAWPMYLLLAGSIVLSPMIVLGEPSDKIASAGLVFSVACGLIAIAFAGAAAIANRSLLAHATIAGIIGVNLISFLTLMGIFNHSADIQFFRIQIFVLIAFLIISAFQMARFIDMTNAVDAFNIHLEKELALTRDSLRESYRREAAQVQAKTLQLERERLMRDLHDGVSGQITSLIARCALGGSAFSEFGNGLRYILHDLRLVIASLEDVGGNLGHVVLNFRDQSDLMLRRLGITLRCRISDFPHIDGWTPKKSLHVFRILQEAISNAAKYSGCKELSLSVELVENIGGSSIHISITDAGQGGAVEMDGCFGLHNMRHRASELGGELVILSGPEGTRIQLVIPVRRDNAQTPSPVIQ